MVRLPDFGRNIGNATGKFNRINVTWYICFHSNQPCLFLICNNTGMTTPATNIPEYYTGWVWGVGVCRMGVGIGVGVAVGGRGRGFRATSWPTMFKFVYTRPNKMSAWQIDLIRRGRLKNRLFNLWITEVIWGPDNHIAINFESTFYIWTDISYPNIIVGTWHLNNRNSKLAPRRSPTRCPVFVNTQLPCKGSRSICLAMNTEYGGMCSRR